MKSQIASSIEQSRHLHSCGVDPKTADMVWTSWESDDEKITRLSIMDEYAYEMGCLNPVPSWSLSTLMSLLPESIFNKGKRVDCQIMIVKHPNFGYRIAYSGLTQSLEDATLFLVENDSLIEACVQMIEWLTANGYSLNKIKE